MANQWGRDSQVRSTGSSPAGPVIAAIACLLVGAGGSYGYLTLTRPDLRPQVETLTLQLKDLATERDKLIKDIAAFRANSGSWAQDLEKELAQLKLEELPKLNRLLDSRDRELGELRAKLTDAEISDKAAASEIAKLQSAIDNLRSTEIPRITEEARQAQAEFSKREEALKKQSADALAAAAKTAHDVQADLDQRLKAANARSADLEKRLVDAAQDVAGTQIAAKLQADLQVMTDKASALQRQVDTLTAELKAAKAAAISRVSDSQQRPVEKPVDQPASTQIPANVVRASAVVEDALNRAVGLQGLAETDRRLLHDKLVSGECVFQSLDAVFDRVPPLVLRNLMRDLRSDC